MPQPKLFTVDQAEKALPLVRRIIKDVVSAYGERKWAIAERRKLPARPKPGSAVEDKCHKYERMLEEIEKNILRYHHELADIGVVLKDYTMGLVDFFSRFEGKVVHLCWRPEDGEHIKFWHDLNAGFLGRQAITSKNRDQFLGSTLREQEDKKKLPQKPSP